MCFSSKNPVAREELSVVFKDVPGVFLHVNNLGNGFYETVAKRKGRVIYRLTERRGKLIRRWGTVVF